MPINGVKLQWSRKEPDSAGLWLWREPCMLRPDKIGAELILPLPGWDGVADTYWFKAARNREWAKVNAKEVK